MGVSITNNYASSFVPNGQTVRASVPMDRRFFKTGPKKILEHRSVQDLKITKMTSKDLFFLIKELLIGFSKWFSGISMTSLLNPS